MTSEKPNFLAQPVVKNIFVYRNGDPYYEPRRLVINEKRVSNFETFLRDVTGGVQAPFGAVRNIYTPRGGHRVASLDHLQSGEHYVAAGREKFKKLDYLQIASRKKRTLLSNGLLKPIPQNRIIVSARFLKPIKEPCAIFVLANGDVLTPAMRFLIPNRVIGRYEHILEMITEKMGLRILGGVRSLCTLDGTPISDGNELENGQFYVAVGREKFKKLPYRDLLFTKPNGMRRIFGSKAASLPPIYRFRKQNGDSMVSSSDSDQAKNSPLGQGTKEHLSSIVREISQARLITLRKKRSGLSVSLGGQDNDDSEQNTPEGSGEGEDKPPEKGGSPGGQNGEADAAKATDTKENAEGAADRVGSSKTDPTAAVGEEKEGENGEDVKKEEGEKGDEGEEEEREADGGAADEKEVTNDEKEAEKEGGSDDIDDKKEGGSENVNDEKEGGSENVNDEKEGGSENVNDEKGSSENVNDEKDAEKEGGSENVNDQHVSEEKSENALSSVSGEGTAVSPCLSKGNSVSSRSCGLAAGAGHRVTGVWLRKRSSHSGPEKDNRTALATGVCKQDMSQTATAKRWRLVKMHLRM
ncbi:doublecortin domain-containing protein 2-like [Chanos chanos]|uniref:Doublecortin domain-containing protein 2 n=1 Tax=Chanos chanos TaxID=29144 RepID=A0A6J2W186_CHACN|nr:doublecortin domain-containing protein 2 [Chanos chanos]